MSPSRRAALPLLLSLAMGAADAATLACDGVLGNSGEQGTTLVRFGAQPARGIGVVCDRFGGLWDRAGRGVLNRYAADGRQTGTYAIPDGADGHDQLTAVGDTLVMLIASRLVALDIAAAPGSAVRSLAKDLRCISFASRGGKIAVATKDRVAWLDIADGTTTPIAPLAEVDGLEVADDAVYAEIKGQLHRLAGGTQDGEGWPRQAPGERLQLVSGTWYAHAWNSTLKRYTSDFEPAPGVVLGGGSGSFIGHLDANADLVNGRGVARLGGDLYAISGLNGLLQLIAWHGDRQQFEVIRRIASVAQCPTLGLDQEGNVYQWNGSWQWNDRPDAPMRLGVSPPEELGQAAMLDGERMIAAGVMWGRPTFFHGRLGEEMHVERIERDCVLKRGIVGATIAHPADQPVLIAIDAHGAAESYAIDAEGRFRADDGATALATASPVAQWTSLAMKDRTTLLAAGDGAVIEFTLQGASWHESRRWRSWGPADSEHFGARIVLAGDGRTLCVSDCERQRVLCFDCASGSLRASFGTLDVRGADLHALSSPTTIAVNGRRIAVYDAGNQRIIKLIARE